MIDSGNKENRNSTPQASVNFTELLRKDERVKKLAVEYAFTPPVPLEQEIHKVVVFVFMTSRKPGVSFKVSPPDYRIVADYPSAKVNSVERVKPADIGLTVAEGEYLGEVKVVSVPYEELEARDKEFERLQNATLEAYFAQRQLVQSSCRRLLELLPIKATEPLMPLLRKTSL
jgi:hypothetical protein